MRMSLRGTDEKFSHIKQFNLINLLCTLCTGLGNTVCSIWLAGSVHMGACVCVCVSAFSSLRSNLNDRS